MLLNPKTIALIGATDRKGSVGLGLIKNLSNKKVFYVNPNRKSILGKKCYSSVLDIREQIDLAIIAVPALFVKQVAKEVNQKAKFCIVISAGFAEKGNDELQDEIGEILSIPFLGPNCMGFINTHEDLNASFSKEMPQKGSIAMISQSGALMNEASTLGSFSFLVSYGNGEGIDISDLLQMAVEDKNTKVIALYVESIKDGVKFIEVAKRIKKPIVVLKGGKTKQGKKAASLHTASLAGEREVYSAGFRKAGVFEVNTLEELVVVSSMLVEYPLCADDLFIITNGGAMGVLASDLCSSYDISLSSISFKGLDIGKFANFGNPLDIVGDALNERYEKVLSFVLKKVNVVLVIQTQQIMTQKKELERTIALLKKKYPKKPIILLKDSLGSTLLGIKALIENHKLGKMNI